MHAQRFGDPPDDAPRLIQLAAFDRLEFGWSDFAPRRQILSAHAAFFAELGDGPAHSSEGGGLLGIARLLA